MSRAATMRITGLVLVLFGALPAHAENLNCGYWLKTSDGKWAPKYPIAIDTGANRWVLKENTTLLPDQSAIIDLPAALDRQCPQAKPRAR